MRTQFRTVITVVSMVVTAAAYAREPDQGERLAMAVTMAEDEEMELIDEFAFLEDAGMVELSARHRQEIGMSPSAVTVLTREDVEASGATNLPDLLRLVPGMDVAISSPSQTSLSSRLYWTNGNHYYQLLIDGRDAMFEVIGQVPWHAEVVSLDDIERIEIVRGPASSMYGASALAGVVSVTTRLVPEKTSASVHITAGELGNLRVGGRASTRIGSWGFSMSGGVDYAGSYNLPRSAGLEVYKFRAMAEYNWSANKRIRIDFGMSDSTGEITSSAGLVNLNILLRTLRVAFESDSIRTRLYWSNTPADFNLEAPLEFGGLRLATFAPIEVDVHSVDGEIQWTLPEVWKSLFAIVGASGRFSYLGSDQLLDGDTYANRSSPDYHKTGIEHLEGRVGAFAHAEYQPGEWVTISGSMRFDYTTETGHFLSPRFVAVFKPHKGQFVRLGISRAFRKPPFLERRLHPMLLFPPDSPVTSDGQESFQEFMARSMSSTDLVNEELFSIEAGYLGQFLDETLSIAIDIYVNQLRNVTGMESHIVSGAQGLPDLNRSIVVVTNNGGDVDILGGELVVRYMPTRMIALMASWAYRELFDRKTATVSDGTPKNLFTLGGRFRTESGLVGSLYVFSRSEFSDGSVENPAGLLTSRLKLHMDNTFMLLGKLGWRWEVDHLFDAEVGIKLFLPFSPFSGGLFSYHEDPGGATPDGRYYGGQKIRRVLTTYLQGSF
jgi:outer membrane receptor protein involved in Fe transport